MAFAVHNDGAFVGLADADERVRSLWNLTKEGPTFLLYDEQTNPRAVLRSLKGVPQLRLLDEKGKVLFAKP